MTQTEEASGASRKPALAARIVRIAVEVVLILLIIALLLATWMPAIVGPTERKQQQNERMRARDR